MNQRDEIVAGLTRRHFLSRCGLGLGSIAFGSLFAEELAAQGQGLRVLHHPARARNVIFLFMAGGPSQLDLFDHKPELARLDGEVVPQSFVQGKRFAFIRKDAKILASPRRFTRHGESGAEFSELVPHMASVADDLLIVKSMVTDEINHGPAKLLVNTGSPQFGRPSMGAWVSYGLGSENRNLPSFIVLQSGPRGPRIGAPLWGPGFLPSRHQGVPFRSKGDPILNLSTPEGFGGGRERRFYDTVNDLNRERLSEQEEEEIRTRIEAYELAFRMQSSAPELIDLSGETPETLEMYGVERGQPSFATNCLLARRMVERGVRFVQLYHTNWDHHGNANSNLGKPLERICAEVDRPSAALVTDLKRRGLLEDTLVIWGGEFGRTPMAEVRTKNPGRDHHIEAYTMWLAGGGLRSGVTLGRTDELGFSPVEDPVHVHDLQATILHQLGIEHERFTYRFQGRDFRLTDVAGEVVDGMLA